MVERIYKCSIVFLNENENCIINMLDSCLLSFMKF